MNVRTALIAHPFPIVVDALAAIAAGAGYAVTRANDAAAVTAALAAQPDLAVVAAGLDDATVAARNGNTRTLVIGDVDRDGTIVLTASVERVAAAIAGERPATATPLTPRERDIARLVAVGQRNRAIAAALGISEGTVKMHLHNVYAKLGLESRTQLAIAAKGLGAD